jgi:hypothetical protein
MSCYPYPILRITDGTVYVDFVGDRTMLEGFYLDRWRPQAPAFKDGGNWQQSAFSQGRTPVHTVYDNTVETFDIKIVGGSQNNAILRMRLLRGLLKQASEYWIHRWKTSPVWVEAKAAYETNTRYAILVDGRIVEDEQPFFQPFAGVNQGRAIQDGISVIVEHRGWRDRAPGVDGDDILLCDDLNEAPRVFDYVYRSLANNVNATNMANTTGNWNIMEHTVYNQLFMGLSESQFRVALFNISSGDGSGVSSFDYHVSAYSSLGFPQFTQVSVEDLTNGFSSKGLNPVIIGNIIDTDPSGWEAINLSDIIVGAPSVTAYWLMCERTGGTLPITQEDQLKFFTDLGVDYGYACFVANKGTLALISNVYVEETGNKFADPPKNLYLSGGWDMLTNTLTEHYVGSANLFTSLVYDIATARVGGTVVWEYWNGTTWRTLPVLDHTGGFSVAGLVTVHWIAPQDWVVDSLLDAYGSTAPDVNAFWVRARLSAGTITVVPVYGDVKVHTANRPYVDIAGSDISGDLAAPIRIEVENLSGTESGRFLGDVGFSPGQSSDDADVDTGAGTIALANNYLRIGNGYNVGIRFRNVALPQNATITAARIRFVVDQTSSNPIDPTYDFIDTKILGEAADNAVTFSTVGDFNTRIGTTVGSFAVWRDTQPWTEGQVLYTPDISVILQDITRRTGWASGNNLVIFIKDEASAVGSVRRVRSWDNASDFAVLELEYTTLGVPSVSRLMVASRSLERGQDFITHLNASGDQNPSFIATTFGTDTAQGAIASLPNFNITGLAARFQSTSYPAPSPIEDRVIFTIGGSYAAQWHGRYRAFARVAFFDDAFNLSVRLRVSTRSGGGTVSALSTIRANRGTALSFGVLDFGMINIDPPGWPTDDSDAIEIAIQMGMQLFEFNTGSVFVFDLILLPIDEYFAEIHDPNDVVGTRLFNGRYLDIDSIRYPRHSVVTRVRRNSDDAVIAPWNSRPVHEIALRPNRDQRLFFFTETATPRFRTIEGGTISRWEDVHKITVRKSQRYQTARGAQ